MSGDDTLLICLCSVVGLFVLTLPLIICLIYYFWKLRSHFVIARRFPTFSMAIVILCIISYLLAICVYSLVYFNIIPKDNEDAWKKNIVAGPSLAHVITCLIFYKTYLVYIRGQVTMFYHIYIYLYFFVV